MDALVQQSVIILALLNKFVYEYRGNNTYVIQEKTLLGIGIGAEIFFPKLKLFFSKYFSCLPKFWGFYKLEKNQALKNNLKIFKIW